MSLYMCQHLPADVVVTAGQEPTGRAAGVPNKRGSGAGVGVRLCREEGLRVVM